MYLSPILSLINVDIMDVPGLSGVMSFITSKSVPIQLYSRYRFWISLTTVSTHVICTHILGAIRCGTQWVIQTKKGLTIRVTFHTSPMIYDSAHSYIANDL